MKNHKNKIQSNDYHDYVIKNGKFIGAFEEMYQNIEDPWNHGTATAIQYDFILFLLRRYNIGNEGGMILDIGCGKGAFTARIKNALPSCSVTGVDISPTAISHAQKSYGLLGIDFVTLDIMENYRSLTTQYDVVIVSQLIWYILPHLQEVMDYLIDYILARDGYLIISQAFYKPSEQIYGKEIVSSVEDLLRFVKLTQIELIESNRLTNHVSIILFQKKVQTRK